MQSDLCSIPARKSDPGAHQQGVLVRSGFCKNCCKNFSKNCCMSTFMQCNEECAQNLPQRDKPPTNVTLSFTSLYYVTSTRSMATAEQYVQYRLPVVGRASRHSPAGLQSGSKALAPSSNLLCCFPRLVSQSDCLRLTEGWQGLPTCLNLQMVCLQAEHVDKSVSEFAKQSCNSYRELQHSCFSRGQQQPQFLMGKIGVFTARNMPRKR